MRRVLRLHARCGRTGSVTRAVSVSGQMPYDDDAAIEGLASDQAAELPLFRAGRTEELVAGCREERELFLTGDPSLAVSSLSEPSDQRSAVGLGSGEDVEQLASDVLT